MKKYLLTLGSLTSVVVPVVTTISCGGSNSNENGNTSLTNGLSSSVFGPIPAGKSVVGHLHDGTPYYGSHNAMSGLSADIKYIIGFTNSGFPIWDVIKGEPVIGYSDANLSKPVFEKDIESHLPTIARHDGIDLTSIIDFINSKPKDYFKKYETFSTVMDESKYGSHAAFVYQSDPDNSDWHTAMTGYETFSTIPTGYSKRMWVTINVHEFMIWLFQNQDKYLNLFN